MDKLGVSVPAFDCDILRSTFRKSVIEDDAALLIVGYTGNDDIDSDVLHWIVRK